MDTVFRGKHGVNLSPDENKCYCACHCSCPACDPETGANPLGDTNAETLGWPNGVAGWDSSTCGCGCLCQPALQQASSLESFRDSTRDEMPG